MLRLALLLSRRLPAFRADRCGAALLEFALLTPVFLLMLVGLIAYGLYFGAAHSVQQLAADAARTSVRGLSPAERDALVGRYLSANAGAYPLLDAGQLRYDIGDKPGDPDQYLVTLRYDAANLPIWNLEIPLPLPSRLITFAATVRRGGI